LPLSRCCRVNDPTVSVLAVASRRRLSLSLLSWPLTCPLDAVVSAVAVSPLATVGSFARCDAFEVKTQQLYKNE
jgi:hypothetical protein